jgi:Divergent InlB B-repeat domain
MRRSRAVAALVAAAAFALAPNGGARERAAGCCYDAHVQGTWNRLNNTATVSWTPPYPDLVSQSVQLGTTIAPTGYLADDGGDLATPGTNGPVTFGAPAFGIDEFVYVQVRFRCMPADPANPRCGPIAPASGTTVVSLPAQLSVPPREDGPPVDYTLSASTDDRTLDVVAGGAGAGATVWVIPEYGFYESVDFSASAPSGLGVSFAPPSSPGSTVATVTASPATPPGSYTVAVTGASEGLSRTDAISVHVSAATPPPAATTTTTTTAPAPVAIRVRKAGAGAGTITGGGISCGPRCTTTRAAGRALTLAERPARGSAFTRWTGGCKGRGARCTFVVEKPVTVTATFAGRR